MISAATTTPPKPPTAKQPPEHPSIVCVLWEGTIDVPAGTLREAVLRFQQRTGCDCHAVFEWFLSKREILDSHHPSFAASCVIGQNVTTFFRERREQGFEPLRALMYLPTDISVDMVPRLIHVSVREEPLVTQTFILDLDRFRLEVGVHSDLRNTWGKRNVHAQAGV